MITIKSIVSWIILQNAPSILGVTNGGSGTAADLEDMFERMEADTLSLASKMQDLLLTKCSEESLESCAHANYGFESQFPAATCPGYDYAIPVCGEGNEGGCGGLFDFTASRISLADPDPDWLDDRAKDGICSSLPLEEYMISATDESKDYWDKYSVNTPWMYYGNDDGVFRIYPGNPQSSTKYDPRIRPWYVAASSGPKDVILVLDTSGSMENAGRMGIMKEAAKRVIGTLGVGDFFAVIEFGTTARIVGGSGDSGDALHRATDENKGNIIDAIDELEAHGGTNFFNGFDLAFRTFDLSTSRELTSGCHKAVLFLSDGILSDSEDILYQKLSDEREKYDAEGKVPPVIFTYSFGSQAQANSRVLQTIACDNDGIWADIADGGDLASSMGAYYKYFAYGLGEGDNDKFVAWVAPYKFSTGGGLGTTASAPVYDHSNPDISPTLAGVVGMDFSFAAMERALGNEGEASKNAIIDKIAERSVAVCPNLKVSKCQLESLRAYGSRDNINHSATCGNCSSGIKPLKSQLCNMSIGYPDELFQNYFNRDRTYEEKTCCSVGEEPRIASDEVVYQICEEKSSLGMIIGVLVGAIGALILAIFIFIRLRASKSKKPLDNAFVSPTEDSISAIPIGNIVESDIVIMPPPSAPTEYK